MKITVTGSTGFVGSHIAQKLLRDGHDLALLARNPSKLIPELRACRVVAGDLLDADSLKDAVRGAAAVVHAAAYVGVWGPRDAYFRANALGTQSVIDACVAAKVRRLVHISSNSVYGDGAGDHVAVPEETPYRKTGIPYGDSKIEAERRVFAAHEDGRIVATAIRPSMVWGPRDRQFFPQIIDALSKGLMIYLGSPDKLVGLTHARNVADLVGLCLEKKKSHGRAYNVDDDDRRTQQDLVRALCARLKFREPRLTVPAFVAMPVANVMEFVWSALRIKTPPLLTKMGVASLAYDNDVSVERAKKELGYKPLDLFDERLDAYLDSFRAGE